MDPQHIVKISQELNLTPRQVGSTIGLLDEGSTIPFIARYRKELTDSLDEVEIASIRNRINQLRELDKRRAVILESLEKLGKLTPELKERIASAETLTVLEDIYLPYRPKKRTRSTIAKEKGLEPLAQKLWEQDPKLDPETEAAAFVDPEKKVESVQDALGGARDIMAEWINEEARARAQIRELFFNKGQFVSKVIKGREEEGIKFRDYFDWKEPVAKAASHRVLAIRRGEKEEFLLLRILAPEADAIGLLESLFIKNNSPSSWEVKLAVADGYKRLLSLSIETEVRIVTKDRADTEAIKVFAENLRELLMSPPLGQKKVLAIDPGFRTGCKIAVLDEQGKLLANDTIYLEQSERLKDEAREKVLALIKKFGAEFIAIGNGTASRETEGFIKGLSLSKGIHTMMVSEQGASVYSASDVAREEFPDLDVSVRGAVSIGRRLMDPLAELVKIDPKSIGVGQYQHDVDQTLLKESLDDVVISCVNQVGVEVNTASKELLMYVSGLGPALARSIVEHRNAQGPFLSREGLLNVPKLNKKAFEQAAGFLRIRGAPNPLDGSAVHPESYAIVDAMVQSLGCSMGDLIREDRLRRQIDLKRYVSGTVGLPTLNDILAELAKPGRDPRKHFEVFNFDDSVQKVEDLKPGMRLPGVVTNVTAFGAFVDIGVHLDGLVHISQLSDKFVRSPGDILKVHQKVTVTVLEVDPLRKRIALSLKSNPKN